MRMVISQMQTQFFMSSNDLPIYYNLFASYAHPPIVRDNANVHEIGSRIPVVDNRYPGISLCCGFDIAATGRKSYVIIGLPYKKNQTVYYP